MLNSLLHIIRRYGWMLACLLLLASCKTKQATKDTNVAFYQTLSTKSTLTLADKGRQLVSVGCVMRIKRDSIIQLSIQPLSGVEVVRIYFTQKEATIVNRINKEYLRMSYEEMIEHLGATKGTSETDLYFVTLQSILSNELFAYGKKMTSGKLKDYFSYSEIAGQTLLQRTVNGISQEFTVNSQNNLQNGSLLSDKASGHWQYNQYEEVNGRLFPMKTDFTLVATDIPTLSLSIEHKKVEFNTVNNFEYTIPSSYKKITWEEFISFFNSTPTR